MSKSQPDISAVVPVYNVDNSLQRCVESIQNQTLGSIEIILVDDGSTDGSSDLCDTLAEKDYRIQVIHKENGGLSSARNVGLKNAKGLFTAFIDSDDYISSQMFENLFTQATTNNLDLAMCGHYDVYENNLVNYCDEHYETICDSTSALGIMLESKYVTLDIVTKLIRTDCIQGKVFFEEGRLYEDVFFLIPLIDSVRSVYINNTPYYYYVHRANSITTSSFTEKDMDLIAGHDLICDEVEMRYSSVLSQAEFRRQWAYFLALDRILLQQKSPTPSEYAQIVSFLKSHAFQILTSSYFSKVRKIALIALYIHPLLYKKLLVAHRRKREHA